MTGLLDSESWLSIPMLVGPIRIVVTWDIFFARADHGRYTS